MALVPLLFGIQQLTEGLVWVSLRHDLPTLQTVATYIYSMFSHVLWPIFVPFAILLVETSRRRKRALGVFQALGLAVGLYLLYFLLRFPVTAHVHGRSITYDSPHFYIVAVLAVYLLATCVSGLFSTHRCINVFGVLAFTLAIAAYRVSVTTFVSVWCFCAAILSLVIYVHFSGPMQACRTSPAASRTSRALTGHPEASRAEIAPRTDDPDALVVSVVSRNLFRDSPGWPGPQEARSLTQATTT